MVRLAPVKPSQLPVKTQYVARVARPARRIILPLPIMAGGTTPTFTRDYKMMRHVQLSPTDTGEIVDFQPYSEDSELVGNKRDTDRPYPG